MNKLSNCIRLVFASNAEPGVPLELDKEATDKLGHILTLMRAFAKCYGSQLGVPKLWGGVIELEICSDSELFDLTDRMVADLAQSALELKENAQCKPPLKHSDVVTHAHCIAVHRALASTFEKCGLTASLHVGNKVIELPHLKMSDFAEPEDQDDKERLLRVQVIGVCAPTQDANVVVLNDRTLLELPIDDYPMSIDELYERVVKCAATFSGAARLCKKDIYRAHSGGKLQSQRPL